MQKEITGTNERLIIVNDKKEIRIYSHGVLFRSDETGVLWNPVGDLIQTYKKSDGWTFREVVNLYYI